MSKRKKTVFSIAMDATKVAEVVDVSSAYGVCLGGAFPDHIVSCDNDASTWLLSGKQKASETLHP